MDNLNNLDSSEILNEVNDDQDLQIEEQINNQLDDDTDGNSEDEADPNDESNESDESDEKKPESKKDHAFKKLKQQKKALRDENAQLKKELAEARAYLKDPMAKYDPSKYTPSQWRNLQIKEGVRAEMTQQTLESKQMQLQARESELYNQEFELKKQDFVKQVKDYDQVMASAKDLFIPDDSMDFIQESDVAPQLAYYLAKNRELAEELADYSPRKRMRFLEKLEDRIQNPVANQVSKAKATPRRNGAGGGNVSLNDAGMAEYAKIRRKQLDSKIRGNR